MILPDHHDIPAELYDERHGDFTYQDDEHTQRCKICDAECDAVGDMYGGMVYCTATGTMVLDF